VYREAASLFLAEEHGLNLGVHGLEGLEIHGRIFAGKQPQPTLLRWPRGTSFAAGLTLRAMMISFSAPLSTASTSLESDVFASSMLTIAMARSLARLS
jgi:hypothetical protein